MITKSQALVFKEKLEQFIVTNPLPSPLEDEGEVHFTRRVMIPCINEFVTTALNSEKIVVRGDGAIRKSLPVSFVGATFWPDLSVEESGIRVWAGEVKVVAESEISSIVAKAIGQSLIYETSYLTSTSFIVPRKPRANYQANILRVTDTVNIIFPKIR